MLHSAEVQSCRVKLAECRRFYGSKRGPCACPCDDRTLDKVAVGSISVAAISGSRHARACRLGRRRRPGGVRRLFAVAAPAPVDCRGCVGTAEVVCADDA